MWGVRIRGKGGGRGDGQDLVVEELYSVGLKLLEEVEIWQVVKLWQAVRLWPPMQVVKLRPSWKVVKLWRPMKEEQERRQERFGRNRWGSSGREGSDLENYQIRLGLWSLQVRKQALV